MTLSDPSNSSVHKGKKIHAGMHKTVWFECELNIEGGSDGPYIEFSSISGEDGSDKQLMSRWSMKDLKPTWLMVASGNGKTALINAYIYHKKEESKKSNKVEEEAVEEETKNPSKPAQAENI